MENLRQQHNDQGSSIQIQILYEKIVFCNLLTDAIRKGSLKQLLQKRMEYISLIGNQKKLKLLLMELINQREIINNMMAENIQTLEDFGFLKILKVLMKPEVHLVIMNIKFDYQFEYYGDSQRLVMTPLTEKCYLCLTLALKLGFGGSPFGPAGTGKTETVKSLAIDLGINCLVFNCDDKFDHHSMGWIFQGMLKCGSWCCFDEFNRLLPMQISVIGSTI